MKIAVTAGIVRECIESIDRSPAGRPLFFPHVVYLHQKLII